MMRILTSVVVSCFVVGASLPAFSQSSKGPNWRAQPVYETVALRAGFTPDPWTRRLQAGGSDRVDPSLGAGCTGFINAAAPDFDLNYTAGSLSLHFRVESAADTTLIVYGPDHRWYCNDDAIGLDPVVSLESPPSGNYNVWVGVHGSAGLRDATLHITEIDPRGAMVSSGSATPNWRAEPTFTTVNLTAGFLPDPWAFDIQAGGSNEITGALGPECSGYIHAAAPDIDLNYEAGGMPLYIFAQSDADTTIAVLDPAGVWHCNDDAIGLNPMVAFDRPRSGNYNVWVGVLRSADTRPATVFVTEFDPRQ